MMVAATEQIPWWLAVITTIGGGAAVWVLREWRTSRKDTIAQLYAIIDRHEKRIDAQDAGIRSLEERAARAEVAEARCQGELTRMELDSKILYEKLRRLQERLWATAPGVIKPCTIIATLPDGVIRNVSIEAGAMFHWDPDQLIGQNIDVLMPTDVKRAHRRSMERLIDEGRTADPSRAISTFGLTKDGKNVPIYVVLSGPWHIGNTLCVNADISRRGDGEAVAPPVPPVKESTDGS
jgi:PAS domain S-box-containing protein